MTRGIIGCVILALLLAAGLGVQWAVEALQAPITGELTQAAQAAARDTSVTFSPLTSTPPCSTRKRPSGAGARHGD